MAFKMKGNPYKMGKMATKSSMKMKKEAMAKMKKESAMDMKEKSPMELKTSYKMKEAMAKMKDESAMKQAKPDYIDLDGDGNKTESMKKAAADKKSPMEQGGKGGFGGKTRFVDKVKAFGQALDAGSNISDTYGRYKSAKRRLRKKAADKSSK